VVLGIIGITPCYLENTSFVSRQQ